MQIESRYSKFGVFEDFHFIKNEGIKRNLKVFEIWTKSKGFGNSAEMGHPKKHGHWQSSDNYRNLDQTKFRCLAKYRRWSTIFLSKFCATLSGSSECLLFSRIKGCGSNPHIFLNFVYLNSFVLWRNKRSKRNQKVQKLWACCGFTPLFV